MEIINHIGFNLFMIIAHTRRPGNWRRTIFIDRIRLDDIIDILGKNDLDLHIRSKRIIISKIPDDVYIVTTFIIIEIFFAILIFRRDQIDFI